MKKLIILLAFTLIAGISVYAVDTNKPETHNGLWERGHGQAAKADMSECLACHEERTECIACHEDMAPRSHNAAWVNKNHGLESRWNRTKCAVCHKDDFCTACHEISFPRSHNRAGFANPESPAFHCQTSCQLPTGTWKNTPAKNCVICHKTTPITKNGTLHALN